MRDSRFEELDRRGLHGRLRRRRLGTLADNWRQEPGTPRHAKPYVVGYVNGLKEEEARRWFHQAPNTPVRAGRLKELNDSPGRGSVGGTFIPRYFNGLRPDQT